MCELCSLKAMAQNALGNESFYMVLLDKLYRSDWRCPYTGEKLVIGVNLSIDHVFPKSRFPDLANNPTNVELVSFRVNLMKNNMTKDEFLAVVSAIHDNAMTIVS